MSVVTSTITSDGKVMDQSWQLLSIDIVRESGRIPYAQLELIDGSPALQQFAISDSGFFDPGKKVEIKLRHEGGPASEKTVFKGLAVSHKVEADQRRLVLNVELKDEAVKLTQVPKNKVFAKSRDDHVINTIIEDAGLKVGKIPQTEVVHEEITQYACSDWDFIVSRADVNGLLVNVTDGSISVAEIKLDGPAKKKFEFGIDDIFAIEMEANGEGQYGDVSCMAWDVKNQKMTSSASGKNVALAPGDFDAKNIASQLGGDSRVLVNPAPALAKEMQSWADAMLARSRLELIRGTISVPGFADIELLDVVEIKGIGKHFNGKALVTGWRHRVTHQGWVTDLRIGLTSALISERDDVGAKPACGLLPPVGGVQVGVVADYEDDPNKEFRVKVKIPALGDDQPAVWARLLAPDAGKSRGFFFRPELGDEVVLGFFNQDPRLPVVLGAMFGSHNTPPDDFKSLSDKNILKGIVTKFGTKIAFDDQDSGKASVYIETSNKNKILLDDQNKTISLADQHGNTITMDDQGITIKSAKAITLEASDKVEIKGSSVDIK